MWRGIIKHYVKWNHKNIHPDLDLMQAVIHTISGVLVPLSVAPQPSPSPSPSPNTAPICPPGGVFGYIQPLMPYLANSVVVRSSPTMRIIPA